MPSFDCVSKLEWPEVMNALNQAARELSTRFDFKGTDAKVERKETGMVVTASTDDRAKAAYEVFQEKLIRRKVSLKHFKAKDPESGLRMTAKMHVEIVEGISKENAKSITVLVKRSKLRVQASIMEDTVRVTAKKRDDLQGIMAELKALDIGIDLQFINFRA